MNTKTNLKKLREARGLSQSQLAAAAGVSVRMIQSYEIKRRDINHAAAITIYKLAQALECDMIDLLEI